jgi:ATP-dependent Lon protease
MANILTEPYTHSQRIEKLLEIVQKTYTAVQLYKVLKIVESNEVFNCILMLQNISTNLKNVGSLLQQNKNIDEISFNVALDEISRDLLLIIKTSGTASLDDLLYLFCGETVSLEKEHSSKYDVLKQFAHPLSYITVDRKPNKQLEVIDINDNDEPMAAAPINDSDEPMAAAPINDSDEPINHEPIVAEPINDSENIFINIDISNACDYISIANVVSKANAIGANANAIGANAIGANANAIGAIGANANAIGAIGTNAIGTNNEHKSFKLSVYGIKIIICVKNQTLVINCLVDDVNLNMMNEPYITNKLLQISVSAAGSASAAGPSANAVGSGPSANASASAAGPNAQWYDYLNTGTFDIFVQSLTLKDMFIYTATAIHRNYIHSQQHIQTIKDLPIENLINMFIKYDLYNKRKLLMSLLLNTDEQEFNYLSYLLYDLLSNDAHGNIDTVEQTLLLDSLPFKIQQQFYNSMKETINYSQKLSHVDINNIPLEQRICLLKTTDTVKEKAMLKLKEIKAKTEESGAKARHYLDGLIKIPFRMLKTEPILRINEECLQLFNNLMKQVGGPYKLETVIPLKTNYNSVELNKYVHVLQTTTVLVVEDNLRALFTNILHGLTRKVLLKVCKTVNAFIKQTSLAYPKISPGNKTVDVLRGEIAAFYTHSKQSIAFLQLLVLLYKDADAAPAFTSLQAKLQTRDFFTQTLTTIDRKCRQRNQYLQDVTTTLNKAVYGHSHAKRQLERIIGQWINGENKGYCFGFEGPPGVGKTSLAKKGIADCLKDEHGVSRPFSFIAIGGSANGSTLEGHNYTYVGSTWGKIVDILMDKKCMNPIIFIDELDKVSKTEHGKEIISILTHLVDPSQNDTFQDKYFNGVDIDVSNILFVFSYNDATLIDKILLDRIHRIKFDNITLDEKLIITQQFILPEIYKKMGLQDVIVISEAVIEYIIEEYTAESGVRKLKELLFDIVGEINLDLLKGAGTSAAGTSAAGTASAAGTGATSAAGTASAAVTIPIHITIKDLQEKYLKDRDEVKPARVHAVAAVGVINGLWANSLGKGGVLPIEANYVPATTFLDLKLTGMQGDVMKESMNVAKTLAWALLTDMDKTRLEAGKSHGLHIHVPEGATPKDGPSAGTAITVVLYSLFTGQKIKHDVAITGEICLQGRVTAIGGLELKILGGIKAGVKTFLFPEDNKKDFEKIRLKYAHRPQFQAVTFLPVAHISEVFPHVFIL